jgi:hypothetical protein
MRISVQTIGAGVTASGSGFRSIGGEAFVLAELTVRSL